MKIEITHTEEYFNGRDHIEVRTLSPRNALLPITQTGYLSHFISATELAKAGGPRRYVDRLLIEGAKQPDPPAKPQPRRRRPALSAPKR